MILVRISIAGAISFGIRLWVLWRNLTTIFINRFAHITPSAFIAGSIVKTDN